MPGGGGPVTFLFTDIESSTELWDTEASAMSTALARHNGIIRAVVDRHAGTVIATAGDSFAVAFAEPEAALISAAEIQRALGEEEWPTSRALRVRIGVHTGLPGAPDDPTGPATNRAARIMAAGHGGQVLVSEAAQRALAQHGDSRRFVWRDLGVHRLRGLARAERLAQLVVPGLVDDFPALRTVAPPSNLPTLDTAFVCRDAELARLCESTARLITLVGPGGVGKTRLAIEWARRHCGPDGSFLVRLAPLVGDGVVVPAIARALRLKADAAAAPADIIDAYLQDHAPVLVLDNCDHLVGEVAEVAARMLEAGHDVRVVATSREALRVPEEHVLPVEPLDPERGAVDLLVDRCRRAGVADPHRWPRAELVEICRRLDGLPLAIELLADQLGVTEPSALLADLERRMASTTRRGGEEHHRSLEAAVTWSWERLQTAERDVVTAVSLFAGAFDVDDAATICGRPSAAVGPVLERMATVSLMAAELGATPRYRLLAIVRAAMASRLAERGDAPAVRERHAEWVRQLLDLPDTDRAPWADRAARAMPELYAALQNVPASRWTPLLLAATPYWTYSAPLADGLAAMDAALAALPPDETGSRAALLEARGDLLNRAATPAAARASWEEALPQAADEAMAGRLCAKLGSSYGPPEHATADRWFARSEALFADAPLDESWAEARIDALLAMVGSAYAAGDLALQEAMLDELDVLLGAHGSARQRRVAAEQRFALLVQRHRYRLPPAELERARELLTVDDDQLDRVDADEIFIRGFVEMIAIRPADASVWLEAAVARAGRLGVRTIETAATAYLALVLRQLGDVAAAAEHADMALALARQTDIPHYEAMSMAVAAWVAWRKGEPAGAVEQASAAITMWAERIPAYPFTWAARTVLAAALVDLGRYSEAAEALQALGQGRDQALPAQVMTAIATLATEQTAKELRSCLAVAQEHYLL